MDDELKLIFSENLKKLLADRDKTQADLCRYMKVSSATVSDWCNGKKIPRADKLQNICSWLQCGLSDLLDKQNPDASLPEYYDLESATLAQEMFDDPDMRFLFHAKRKMSPERFQRSIDTLKDAYKLENPDDDYGC